MVKCRIVLILFMFFAVNAKMVFAIDDDRYHLASEYGKNLKGAPYALRYIFERDIKVKWSESTYGQRKAFLTYLADKQAKEEAKQRAKDKAQYELQRREEKIKKEKEKAAQQKQRARDRAEQEEAKEEADQQKAFSKRVYQQEKSIDQMRRQQKETRTDN